MIILFGRYRFWRRVIGCRKDYCNSCGNEVISEEWRAFYFFHLFLIPLIPLGLYKYWECAECHNDPRARYETGRGMKITGVIIFGLMFIGSLFMPYTGEDAGGGWTFRIFSLAIALWIAYSLNKHRDGDPLNRERRKQVVPITEDCPYCSIKLFRDPNVFCPKCKVKIYQD